MKQQKKLCITLYFSNAPYKMPTTCMLYSCFSSCDCIKNADSLHIVFVALSSNYILELHREKEEVVQFQWQIQIRELRNTKIKSGWVMLYSEGT